MRKFAVVVRTTDASAILRAHPHLVDMSAAPPAVVGDCRWVPVSHPSHGMIEWRNNEFHCR